MATDPDGDTMTFSCVQGCPSGFVVDSATGAFSWLPPYLDDVDGDGNVVNSSSKPFNGAYGNIVLSVADSEGQTLVGPIKITVINVDRPPVFTDLNTPYGVNPVFGDFVPNNQYMRPILCLT